MKTNKLNQWLWKWHFIAGVISLPFVLVLAITGGIYLFKDKVEQPIITKMQSVTIKPEILSYQKQWEIAKSNSHKAPSSVIISTSKSQATQFVAGKFSHKTSIYVNPYSGEVIGSFAPKNTWMHTVRKIHGELLGGKIGTKLVELIASWMLVLILTGIYIFWPARERGIKGFYSIRFRQGKRILFRDLHSIGGFWISALLLITLAGGFPWTDIVGGNFKKLQQITNTGFPKEWHGIGIHSDERNNAGSQPLSLDNMIAITNNLELPGTVSLDFPKGKKGIFSVSNTTFPLRNQQKIHFDQYTGKQLKALKWHDVGILMRGRMWLMAFHQGQFGGWNFALMLFVAIGLTLVSSAGLLSYILRKQKGNWGIPKVPESFKVGYGVIATIILLGLLFPLFGLSALLIIGILFFKKTKAS